MTQGTFVRSFSLQVGPGAPGCTQSVCASALAVEDGLAPGLLRLTRGASEAVNLSFSLSCHAIDSTIYWGQASGHMTGASWTQSACGSGASGSVSVNPGALPPGGLFYFVAVPVNGVSEGSYGRDSSGAERPVGSGACHLPQQLGGICP